MAVETREEALAFIDAMRLTIQGKVGFKWMTERLSELTAYVVSVADENERLKASLGTSGEEATTPSLGASLGAKSSPQKLTPNLWFDSQAEEAAEFYVSVFPDSEIIRTSHHGEEGFEVHGRPAGTVLTVDFRLGDMHFVGLNGGPLFPFTEAISFVIDCADQAEVDYYWDRLGEGGDPDAQQCGWLKDAFGVSWQVVPEALGRLMSDPDPAVGQRVMAAFLPMKKLIIADLERAARG